jgi:hypothetical protein
LRRIYQQPTRLGWSPQSWNVPSGMVAPRSLVAVKFAMLKSAWKRLASDKSA